MNEAEQHFLKRCDYFDKYITEKGKRIQLEIENEYLHHQIDKLTHENIRLVKKLEEASHER